MQCPTKNLSRKITTAYFLQINTCLYATTKHVKTEWKTAKGSRKSLRRLHAQSENFLSRPWNLKVIKSRMRQKRHVSITQAMYV
jgi:hypothetical protein